MYDDASPLIPWQSSFEIIFEISAAIVLLHYLDSNSVKSGQNLQLP